MVMDVVMEDAIASRPEGVRGLTDTGAMSELLHANDTLLLRVSGKTLEIFLDAVQTAGAKFGLSLHTDEFQLVRVRSQDSVNLRDGPHMHTAEEMFYLGSTVAGDGRLDKKPGQRSGLTHAEFRTLARVWRHSSLTRHRKIHIFNALFVSRLTYALAAACLSTSEKTAGGRIPQSLLARIVVDSACILLAESALERPSPL